MKRQILFIFVTLLLGTFGLGCSDKENQSESDDANTTAQVTNPGDQDTTDALIQPGIGVGQIKLNMTVDDIKAALGRPDIDATGISYVYADLGIEVVFKNDKVLNILCVHHINNAPNVKACKYRTVKGTGIGSTESDVTSAYGEPTKLSNGALMYKELGLRFKLEDGQVHTIIVY